MEESGMEKTMMAGNMDQGRRQGRFCKVDETEISPQGFISVPDQIWRNELSKEERDFVVAHNAKKRHV
eukprot:3679292-Ditylum_brightwellii.AAC.1